MFGYLMIEGGEHAGSTAFFTVSDFKQDCASINEFAVGAHV